MYRSVQYIAAMPDGQPTPRQRLLDALIDHLEEHGLGDTSLRGLAAAAGTSHRMLSYHFGSRSALLVEVTREVERRQRAALADLRADPTAGPMEVMWQMHRRLGDPALWPLARLFFELYARALQGEEEGRALLDEAIEAWLEPLVALFEQLGFQGEEAAAEARLALAVARGLLLDLLATGDRAGVDAAAARYFARYDGIAAAQG